MQNKVQDLRTEKQITQEEMAASLGITRQTVISIEKGNYTPSLLLAMKIAKFFKLKIEEIFWIK